LIIVFLGVRQGAVFTGSRPQGNRQDDRGAARRGTHVQPAAHLGGALAQAQQAEGLGLAQRLALQAAAVVVHFQREHALEVAELDVHRRGLGVLGDVGERLLGRAVGHQLHVARHVDGRRGAPHHHAQRGAVLETGRQPLHRGHQALVQDGRAQVAHDALAGLQRVLQHVHGAAQVLVHMRALAVAAHPGQVQLDGGERAADVVVDLAGDVGALLLDAGLQVFGQLGQALARFGQFGVGAGLGPAALAHLQCALDHVREPVHAVLEQVVAHALVDGLHRGGLADGTREQDEGQVRAALAHQAPGVQPGEAGQVVVGQHDVVAAAGKFAGEVVQRVHQHQRAGHLAALEGKAHQRVVHPRVFQVQDADHGRLIGRGVSTHGSGWVASGAAAGTGGPRRRKRG
jgi:hypothetical protein